MKCKTFDKGNKAKAVNELTEITGKLYRELDEYDCSSAAHHIIVNSNDVKNSRERLSEMRDSVMFIMDTLYALGFCELMGEDITGRW